MPQHDFNIANNLFPLVRQDINEALSAIATWQSGSTAPTTTFAFMRWADTSTTPATLRMRNAANNAWLVVGRADTAFWGITPADIDAQPTNNPSFTGTLSSAGNFVGAAKIFANTNIDVCNFGSFTLGGNSTTFYPVRFTLNSTFVNPCRHRLRIFRGDKDAGASNAGTFFLSFEFAPTQNGKQQTRIKNLIYETGLGTPYNNPVGDIQDASYASNGTDVIIWLRGGATYNWACPDSSGSWTLTNGNAGGTSITDSSGTTRNTISTQSLKILKARARHNNEHPALVLQASIPTSQDLILDTWAVINTFGTGYIRDDVSLSSGVLTVQTPGLYKITGSTGFSAVNGTPPTAHALYLGVSVNAALPTAALATNTLKDIYQNLWLSVNGSYVTSLNANDQISLVYFYTAVGGSGYTPRIGVPTTFVVEQLDIYDD